MNKQIQFIFNTLAVTSFLGVIVLFASFFNKKELAYVDSVRLMRGYKGMEAAQKDLQSKMMIWNANIDTLKNEFNNKVIDYQKRQAKLSTTERKLTEELLSVKEQQLVNYQQSVTEKVQQENAELSGKVLSKVNDFVKRYGEKKQYTIILATTQDGNIVYADRGIDITDEVVNGLNAEYIK